MGIKNLTRFIKEKAPNSFKETQFSNYFGKRIVIDASISLYQFLVAIRSAEAQLTNQSGQVTSHLTGLFYRTIKVLENGIKPIYVFDGKPPEHKKETLKLRAEAKELAEKKREQAKDEGNEEDVAKFSRHAVRVDPKNIEDAQKLLRLMGVPYIVAPSEAEASCVELVKNNLAYAIATEDSDCLTHGGKIMLRNFFTSAVKKDTSIVEYQLDKILQELNLTYEMFVDFCILLGCDYAPKIKGIGPHKAYDFIVKYGNIEDFLKNRPEYKFETEVDLNIVRNLFCKPDVVDCGVESNVDFNWVPPNETELIEFMVKENSFSETSIVNGISRLKKSLSNFKQTRLDDFFSSARVVSSNICVKVNKRRMRNRMRASAPVWEGKNKNRK